MNAPNDVVTIISNISSASDLLQFVFILRTLKLSLLT